MFEVVLALITYGALFAIKQSTRVAKILKWLPNLKSVKKIIPSKNDRYSVDLDKMNLDVEKRKVLGADGKIEHNNQNNNVKKQESPKEQKAEEELKGNILSLQIEKTKDLSKLVPSEYRIWGQCDKYADSLKSKMKQNYLIGEHIRIESIGGAPFMPSKSYKMHNGNISENAFHEAIKIGDTIFDNLHYDGVNFEWWKNDLDITDLINEGIYTKTNKPW